MPPVSRRVTPQLIGIIEHPKDWVCISRRAGRTRREVDLLADNGEENRNGMTHTGPFSQAEDWGAVHPWRRRREIKYSLRQRRPMIRKDDWCRHTVWRRQDHICTALQLRRERCAAARRAETIGDTGPTGEGCAACVIHSIRPRAWRGADLDSRMAKIEAKLPRRIATRVR